MKSVRLFLFPPLVMVLIGGARIVHAEESPWDVLSGAQGQQASQPQPQTAPAVQVDPSRQYHFLFFFREQNPQTDAMWTVCQSAIQMSGGRAISHPMNIADPASQQYVRGYNLGNPTTPLVLSVAPNGALMGVFTQPFSEQQLLQTFGTPGQEACQLNFMQGKMVLLCIQNQRTQFNREAMTGVQGLLQDFRFQNYASAVMVDPADPQEAPLLQQLQVTPNIGSAVTILMTPPGVPVATLNGAISKEVLIAELKNEGGCGAECQCLESVPAGGDSKPVLSKFFDKIAGKSNK